ncbi:hypothetical protein QOT17_023424 [Balamuthia mandrillaris]
MNDNTSPTPPPPPSQPRIWPNGTNVASKIKLATKQSPSFIGPPPEAIDFSAPLSFTSLHHGFVFHSEQNCWVPVCASSSSFADPKPLPPFRQRPQPQLTLRVLTFNIDGQTPFRQTRTKTMLRCLLPRWEADIMAFQEVRQDALEWLLEDGWIRQHYYASEIQVENAGFHKRVTFSRFPFQLVLDHALHSHRDRTFLLTQVLFSSSSGGYEDVALRQDQMHTVMKVMRAKLDDEEEDRRTTATLPRGDPPPVLGLIVGDLNVLRGEKVVVKAPSSASSSAEEKTEEDKQTYEDLWRAIHGKSSKGYTYDTERNSWTDKQTRDHRSKEGLPYINQQRHDRMLMAKQCSNSSFVWCCSDIELVATESLKQTKQRWTNENEKEKEEEEVAEDVFPSDHFGLLATFRLTEYKE